MHFQVVKEKVEAWNARVDADGSGILVARENRNAEVLFEGETRGADVPVVVLLHSYMDFRERRLALFEGREGFEDEVLRERVRGWLLKADKCRFEGAMTRYLPDVCGFHLVLVTYFDVHLEYVALEEAKARETSFPEDSTTASFPRDPYGDVRSLIRSFQGNADDCSNSPAELAAIVAEAPYASFCRMNSLSDFAKGLVYGNPVNVVLSFSVFGRGKCSCVRTLGPFVPFTVRRQTVQLVDDS